MQQPKLTIFYNNYKLFLYMLKINYLH